MASRLRRVFIFGCLLVVAMWLVLEAFVAFTPLPDSLSQELKGTPTLLDRDGIVVAHFPSHDGIARIQIPVPLEQTGEWLPKVTVALEDHRYYGHSGVDYYAIFAAVARNLRNPDRLSGASTISQQLIKLCDQRKGESAVGQAA